MSKTMLTAENWLKENNGLFPTRILAMQGYASYVLSGHRKQAKYFFEGKVYTEEELRSCGLTMHEGNAPILIKEGIILPEREKSSRFSKWHNGFNEALSRVKRLNNIQE